MDERADPAEPLTSPAAEPVRTSDALTWARRQLSADGVRRLLTLGARLLRGVRVLGLLTIAWALAGVLIALLLVRDQTGLLVLSILLCAPALLGSVLARIRLRRLAVSLEHPDEMGTQARDLAVGLRDSAELRRLADRVRHRSEASGGRLRRAFGTARLASTVLGQTGPDPRRHPRLVPFTPTRLRGLWFVLTMAVVGVPLVFVAILLTVLGALTSGL